MRKRNRNRAAAASRSRTTPETSGRSKPSSMSFSQFAGRSVAGLPLIVTCIQPSQGRRSPLMSTTGPPASKASTNLRRICELASKGRLAFDLIDAHQIKLVFVS